MNKIDFEKNKLNLLKNRGEELRISAIDFGHKIKQFYKNPSIANLNSIFTKKFILNLTATAAISTMSLFLTEASQLTSFVYKPRIEKPKLSALFVANPTIRYGFALDTFHVVENKVKSDDVFVTMLTKRGLKYDDADSLTKVANTFYNFNTIQDGKPYVVLSKDPAKSNEYFIYEPDAKRYIIFDLKALTVKEVKREVSIKEFEASGKIRENLWETLVGDGMSYELTDKVEDALKYQVDLRKFKKGDEYKIIWDEELVEGRSAGVKCMKAAYFKKSDDTKPIHVIFFDNGSEKGWYTKDGLPMRDGFLKSPLKYSRITSHYSLNRLHPILGYHRPHFGTDYAAPHGTPILSVADGVVMEARYAGGNGNYVKIKHMKPYESQYLHMSRFAKGIRPGTKVKQGEVIGYVGSTGLATGPHVCFRFWKNEKQVNHLNEKLPQVSTFSSADRARFKAKSDSLIAHLNNVPFLDENGMKLQKKVLTTLRGKP
jgi:murein DD-endopeptidase MepM/ murein hydrolase activator NlpD